MSDLSQMLKLKVDPVVLAKVGVILLENLPQAIQTGEQLLTYISTGVSHLLSLWNSATPLTVADVQALLDKETIQAIHIASEN